MKSKPILVNKDKTGQTLDPIDPEKKLFTESWLQELIQKHPQILPVDEIEQVFWPLIPIGREIKTDTGFIDNLLISKAGYPVLVETKLWRNSEAKREVIAQAIDYAGELSKWSFEKFNNVVRKSTSKGVIELIQETFEPVPEELPSEEDIAKNLRLGRFLILIVSDHIRNSLSSLLEYTNRYHHLATNVGLVELLCYEMPNDTGEIMVVPSIVAKTKIIERSIIEVILEPNQPHQINIQQSEKSEEIKRTSNFLSEEAFWEEVKQKSQESLSIIKEIYSHFIVNPLINFQMGKSSITIKLMLGPSQTVSVLIMNSNGKIECWPMTIQNQLESASINSQISESYINEISGVLKYKSDKNRPYIQANKINIEELFQVIDKLINSISE